MRGDYERGVWEDNMRGEEKRDEREDRGEKREQPRETTTTNHEHKPPLACYMVNNCKKIGKIFFIQGDS